MGATSVTGTGHGSAGLKVGPLSNVDHVLITSSANDGDTIGDDINVVFLTVDDDYTLNLPDPKKFIGKTIYLRTRTTGHTVTLNPIYGGDYSFSTAQANLTIISDGVEWSVCGWYVED